jgi:hypothetical protein
MDDDPYEYEYETYEKRRLPPPPPSNAQPYMTEEGYYNNSRASFSYNDENIAALELQKREEYLNEKEKMLNQKQVEIQERNGNTKNWPVCFPLIKHDIFTDIPSGLRRTATCMGYVGWFLFSLIIILNLGCAIACVALDFKIHALTPMMKVQFIFMAAVFLIFIPGYFIFAYYPLYHAMRTVNMTRFFLFFIGNITLIIFLSCCVAGWIDYGPNGIVGAIYFGSKGISKSKEVLAAFIINVVMGSIWLALDIYCFIIFVMALIVYWKQNTTFAKAKDFAKQRIEARRARSDSQISDIEQ